MSSARCQTVESDAIVLLGEPLLDRLRQRASLFERILADLLGPRLILQRGLLPAEFAACLPLSDTGPGLHAYAADLALWPDGAWRVARDVIGGADPAACARLLEAPALAPFLPGLCRFLLGETLRLESAPSRWLGDPGALAEVVANRHRWAIVDALQQEEAFRLGDMTTAQRVRLQERVGAAPWRFAARLLGPEKAGRIAIARCTRGHWLAVAANSLVRDARH